MDTMLERKKKVSIEPTGIGISLLKSFEEYLKYLTEELYKKNQGQ